MLAGNQPKYESAVVCAAKHGDLLNILPVLKHFHDKGNPCDLVHSALFTSTLLGINYLHPVALRITPNDADKAVRWAQTRYKTVLRLHEFGKGYHGPYDHPYNVRQWLKAGLSGEQFHDLDNFPLVFDRDSEREAFLVRRTVKTSRPLLLLALACSKSSPFPSHYILTESIRKRFSERCEIMNLCKVKAARLRDIMGLLDRAFALVTSDGSALHLAAAAPRLKVVALVNNNPVLASEPRYKPILKLTYSEAIRRAGEIHAALLRSFLSRHPPAQREQSDCGNGQSPPARQLNLDEQHESKYSDYQKCRAK